MRRTLRFLYVAIAVGLLLALLVAGFGVITLRASLAQLDGSRSVTGLSANVHIHRDALGVPEISAAHRLDASRALGFLHGQERFFQMDLLRRRGAGELAALLGPALVDVDTFARRHRLRAVAQASLPLLPARHRELLDAYVDGVNAGLNALRARPPEYFLLRTHPKAWKPEDSLLVGFAMYFALQDPEGHGETHRAALDRLLPTEVRRFFFPLGSEWDAPLDNSAWPTPPMPGAEIIDVSKEVQSPPRPQALRFPPNLPRSVAPQDADVEPLLVPGSNSWGVEGMSSTYGAAIVANDMHLDLGLPNIWFRVCMRWTDADQRPRRMVGVTLPGVPTLIVGSTGDIAWGFTNASIDTTDRILLELDPSDPTRYRTPDGWKSFETVTEQIEVAGESPRAFRFDSTIWGPVIGDSKTTPRHAVRWIAHVRGAINLGLFDLESSRTVQEALDLAPGCGIPVENFLVGDSKGSLGYSLIGPIPRRMGFDGRTPQSWADGARRWDGWLPPGSYPRIVARHGDRFWTANNRILGSETYMAIGGELTDGGARAKQIRDNLLALPPKTDEPGLFSIYRDDRAVYLERWQKLLLTTVSQSPPAGSTNSVDWANARSFIENWGGRAAVDSVGYRLVRAFRGQVVSRIYGPLLESQPSVLVAALGFGERSEPAVWTLLEKRPRHLLARRFDNYDSLLREAFDTVLNSLRQQRIPLQNATWGHRNKLHIQHPIAKAVPALGRLLNMPPTPMPGDTDMPRVQGTDFGASERLVVSPGYEERGIFQMPGGQSGHFLSPFYRAGHDAWARVEPSPLLPGPSRHHLVLAPPAR